MIIRNLLLIFSLFLLSCSHKNSNQRLTRKPASFNFSNLPELDAKNWLDEISNNDVYKNRDAGTKYGKAAAGKIVEALKLIKMYPGASRRSYFQKFEAKSLNSRISSQNIIALSHPKGDRLPEIIISAHYNRVSFCPKSTMKGCYVKTDNSAGAIAVIKAAQLLKRHSPSTSFAITLWGAEELNSSGSEYFAQQPSFSLRKVKQHINLDIMGNNQKITKDENIKTNISRARSGHLSFTNKGYQIETTFFTDSHGLSFKKISPRRKSTHIKKINEVAKKVLNIGQSLTRKI